MSIRKILIVDDSETTRIQLRRDLEAAGFEVVEGHNGVHGLEVLAQHADVMLIISDVNMPRMDGLDMAKRIHDMPEHKQLPILIITAETSPTMKAKGKEAGVLAWATKPYTVAKLIPVVEKIVK